MTTPNPNALNILKALENNIEASTTEKFQDVQRAADNLLKAAEVWKQHLVLQLITNSFSPKKESVDNGS